MKVLINGFFRLLLALAINSLSSAVLADVKSLCVFDLLGANGPIYAQMKDYQIAAMNWGVNFRLKPYLSEKKAAADFKSGQCDAVSFTGIQSRQFNLFSGSLDAMGALPTYSHLKTIINTISSKQAAPLMISKPYEVVGVIPLGAAYLFVNDRSLVEDPVDKVGSLAEIRVAVMESDPAQIELVGLIGTTSVSTSIAEMYKKFNTGSVDATYGPAVVYEAMELQQGMQTNGGVVRFPLAQLTLQILTHIARFPEQFGHMSRQYALSQFDNAVKYAKNHERRIAPQWWISISKSDQDQYHEMYRKTRILLRKKGIYDNKMLKLMRMVRCKKMPKQSECASVEE